MMKSMLNLFVFFCIFSASAMARTTVYGKVSGADGHPIPAANVFLCHPSDDRPVESVAVGKEGSYDIVIPADGIWMLHFTGIFHREYPVAIYAIDGRKLRLDVRLRTYNYGSAFTPAVIGNFNGWSISKRVPLKRAAGGLYFATVKNNSDTLFYRLVNVRPGGQVEGTDAEGYVAHGIENYNSFLVSRGRDVRIEFDPNRLPYSEKKSSFRFGRRSSLEARFAGAYAVYVDAEQASRESFFKSEVDHKLMGYKFNYTPYIKRLKSLLRQEHSKLVRQTLELSYFSVRYLSTNGNVVNPKTCQLLFKDIPPSSVVWSLHPSAISQAIDLSGLPMYKRMDYMRDVLNSNPIPQTKVILLTDRIDRIYHSLDQDKIIPYLSSLVDEYGDFPQAASYARTYRRYIKPKDGSPAPLFSVKSLPDTSSRISNGVFKGKYYLMAFWSPADRASVNEIERLKKLQGSYANDKLDMVSIAVNFPSKSRRKHKMNENQLRYNAEVVNGFNNEICEEYEVYSLPKLVLVGPTGNVVASGWELHGNKLDSALKDLP